MGITEKERKEYENKIDSEFKELYDKKKNGLKYEELDKILIPDNFKDKDVKKKIKEYSVLDNYCKVKKEKYKQLLIEETFKKSSENSKQIERLLKTINDLELQRKDYTIEKLKNDLSNREEELSKSKRDLKDFEEKSKQQEKKIEEIIKEKKRKEEEIKNISKDSQTKENEIKTIQKEYEKQLQDLEKKFNDEFDKFKKEEIQKEKNRIRKKNNVCRTFNQKIEKMKESKIKQILEQLKKSENDYCISDISKCWEKNVSFFIKNLFDSEKIISTIIYHLKLFIDEYKKKLLNIEHLNIILVGPSGVGKSTLINAILKVNAKENFGRPETKDSCYYESEEIPFLRLADSRGIEKDTKLGVDQIFESIQRFIKSQIETNDPDKFIHCIWYCWCGSRLEENEMKLFKKLSETYSLETIPIIIVYTKAIDVNETEKAKNYIFNENKLNNDFIDIVSKDIDVGQCILPSRNLDKLKEISIKRAKEAIKSSCYEGILNEVKKNIKKTLEKLMIELKNKSNREANKIISNMKNNSKIETLHEETNNIITSLFYQYFFLSANVIINKRFHRGQLGDLKYSISRKSEIIIQDFSVQYFEEIMKIYEDNIDSLIKIYSKELLSEIMTFQNDFNKVNDNLLEVKWTSSEMESSLHNYIYGKISKTIELNVLKNSFKFIITPLIEKFAIFFEKSYISLMESKKDNDFTTYAKEITKVSFESLEQKIKEYNELNNKKKETIEKTEKTEKTEKIEKTENNEDNENLDNDLIDSMINNYNNEEENAKNQKINEDVKEAAPTKSKDNSDDKLKDSLSGNCNDEENIKKEKIKEDAEEAVVSKSKDNSVDILKDSEIDKKKNRYIKNNKEENKIIEPKVYITSEKSESIKEKIKNKEIEYSSKDIKEDKNIGNSKEEKNKENVEYKEEKKSNNTENNNIGKRYRRRYISKNH